jgi:hypothetical protein
MRPWAARRRISSAIRFWSRFWAASALASALAASDLSLASSA